MKRKAVLTLGVLFLMAALVAVSVPAKAEMYVEAYLGGVGAGDVSHDIDIALTGIPGSYRGTSPGGTNAAVLGGIKIGTWFVPTGFLGYSYPDWMKYFGFYTDFSYHRLDVYNQNFNAGFFAPGFVGNRSLDFDSEGTVATWAFMFAFRYGFFQDSEVPFGRLQPYVAVGPAIMFSTQEVKITNNTLGASIPVGSQSSTNIALAVDAGIRYMCLKNVSIDLSFKYRMANPTYDYVGWQSGGVAVLTPARFKYEPSYNMFSGQLGVAYHF